MADSSLGSAGPKRTVTSTNNGQTLRCTNASESDVGCVAIEFVPDGSFNGSFQIVARTQSKEAADDAIDFTPQPYRLMSGVGATGAVTAAGTAVSAPARILVPAQGVSVGIKPTVNSGSCAVYTVPLVGPPVI
jgi:hypothetical protein